MPTPGPAACAMAFALLLGKSADAQSLPAYNADIGQSSISGISSGAFMAVQFATAWSSVITGVGVIAGGPFYCAQASAADILDGYVLPMLIATGPCMKGPPPDIAVLAAAADGMAQTGDIDAMSHLAREKIYLFHGYNDAVVARSVTDDAADFYRHYMGPASDGNLFYQTSVGAGHAQIVLGVGGTDGLNACTANQPPYINQCDYDQAGILLQHIYGALNPRNPGAPTGALTAFAQSPYTAPFSTEVMGLAETGFVYVPAACAAMAACRVHIALHGCKQDAADIGARYVTDAGYNAWADTNAFIVLYPQTRVGLGLGVAPMNPQACWDWFGYVNQDSSYVTKGGRQIGAIKAMLDALTAGVAAPAPLASNPGAAAPGGLAVIDTSDTAAALVWRAVPGADGYLVLRARAAGPFKVVGRVGAIGSFADMNLTPETDYRWQIIALINGVGGLVSPLAVAKTRPEPPLCARPAAC